MILNLSGMEFLSLFTNLSASVWRRRTAGVDISYAVRQTQKYTSKSKKKKKNPVEYDLPNP